MTTTVTTIRGRIAPGERYIWEVLVDIGPSEAPAVIPITATLPADVADRHVTLEFTGDVTLDSGKRTRTEYTGPISETVNFGAEGGTVQFTIKDLPQRTIQSGAVQPTVVIDGSTTTVTAVVSNDFFQRSGGLSGDAAYQRLMTVSGNDEDYVEDMLNAGWNLATILRSLEQFQNYIPAIDQVSGTGGLLRRYGPYEVDIEAISTDSGNPTTLLTVPTGMFASGGIIELASGTGGDLFLTVDGSNGYNAALTEAGGRAYLAFDAEGSSLTDVPDEAVVGIYLNGSGDGIAKVWVLLYDLNPPVGLATGAIGIPGAAGAAGADGVDGADGADGADGVDGVDGSNASPDLFYWMHYT